MKYLKCQTLAGLLRPYSSMALAPLQLVLLEVINLFRFSLDVVPGSSLHSAGGADFMESGSVKGDCSQ